MKGVPMHGRIAVPKCNDDCSASPTGVAGLAANGKTRIMAHFDSTWK
jgi:hypothetical protein